MKTLALLLFAFLAVDSCNDKPTQETTVSIYWVASKKVPCKGVGEQQCLQLQKGEEVKEDAWKLFYSTIDGFSYEPGYRYKIKVSQVKNDPANVPADVSSIQYTLLEVLEKVPVVAVSGSNRLHDIWALQAMNGDVLKSEQFSQMMKRPVLEIFVDEKRFGGNDSCNNIFGSIVSLSENEISFGNLGGTKMACPNMGFSAEYTKALQQVKSYKLERLTLYFYNEAGREILNYKKID